MGEGTLLRDCLPQYAKSPFRSPFVEKLESALFNNQRRHSFTDAQLIQSLIPEVKRMVA